MHQFTLELLFQIIGIGSASGLIFKNDSLFLISDNSNQLFEYQLKNQTTNKTILLEHPVSENIAKNQKPDFEAIASHGDDYYIFGSGSTENRNTMVHYNVKNQITKSHDLTNLYLSMQSFGGIPPEDFNIEGVVFTGDTWYFLQRGNGISGKNAIFTVQGKNLENDFTMLFNFYKLPKIKGVRSSFTDGVIVDNQLYFLATAEDSKSTYEDGEVLGSLIGSINLHSMKIESKLKITDMHKFEGITLQRQTAEKLEFLLCEDNDTESLESGIYKLTIDR